MPAGRVLLLLPFSQEGTDAWTDRARCVSMGAVVSLAGWVDGVGAVTTRVEKWGVVKRCM